MVSASSLACGASFTVTRAVSDSAWNAAVEPIARAIAEISQSPSSGGVKVALFGPYAPSVVHSGAWGTRARNRYSGVTPLGEVAVACSAIAVLLGNSAPVVGVSSTTAVHGAGSRVSTVVTMFEVNTVVVPWA